MKTRTFLFAAAAAAAALLAGCGHKHHDSHGNRDCCVPGNVNSQNPQVSYDPARDTSPVVVPNPLTFTKEQKGITITWRMARGSKARFDPKVGIVIDGEITRNFYPGNDNRKAGAGAAGIAPDPTQNEIVDCQVRDDGLAFTCVNRHTRPGIYKYTITLTDGSKRIVHDPEIVNW